METIVNKRVTITFIKISEDLAQAKTKQILSIISDALKKAYMEVDNGANGNNQESFSNGRQRQQHVCNGVDNVSSNE